LILIFYNPCTPGVESTNESIANINVRVEEQMTQNLNAVDVILNVSFRHFLIDISHNPNKQATVSKKITLVLPTVKVSSTINIRLMIK
jgi:hypothetical protein